MKKTVTLLLCIYLSLYLGGGVRAFDTAESALEDSDYSISSSSALNNYDYIVVGGGASGSVVATRLSENPANKVLLIEAGGPSQRSLGGKDYVAAQYKKTPEGDTIFKEPLTRYDVPAFANSAQPSDPKNPTEGFTFNFQNGPEVPHARILGGNGVHNNMVWTRATRGTINAWNVTGWNYTDVLPYYKKSENVTGSRLNGDTTYHGHTGPIQLTDPRGQDKSGAIFIQACINAGYGNNTDFNGAQRAGCGLHVFNINSEGIRDSSANAYLAPARKRSNLRIILNALVTKILFNTTANPVRATSVRFEKGGNTYTIKAKKEIILSLGTINSPKLLMLSGIGPAAHLTSLGIPVIKNLPVGRGLRSHGGATVRYQYPNETYPSVYDISTSAAEYAQFGTGPLASSGYFGFGFVKTDNTKPEANMLIGVTAIGTPRVINVQLSLHQPEGNELGFVNLTSTDPHDPPFVYLNIWDNENNVISVANAIKIARTIMTTSPAPTIFGSEILPGATYNNDTRLRDYVRAGNTGSRSHVWGGCVMRNLDDPAGVLDPRARVRGIQGLRVCDLSIVPRVMGGHPMANVVMFGERISEFILQDNA